jgi:hypothetical protein
MVINMEEVCEFICQKTGLSEELVDSILECELEFLELKEVVGEGPKDTVQDHVFIDTDELEAFITRKLSISEEIVSSVLGTEDEFLRAKGIIEEV